MKALIVLAQAKKEGFNRAIASEIMASEAMSTISETNLLDLYAENFNPVMPAEELPRKFSFDEATLRYQEAIREAGRLVFVHPDWWGGPPAILKGFIDRVFRPGVAYGFREADFRDENAPGLFAGKRVDVFMTTDATPPPSGKADDWPPARVWKHNVLEFCGVLDSRIHVFWNLRKSSYAERRQWLNQVVDLVQ
ncbi:MAG: NAD(P)H-dependent oxidoreductase [Clostridia bacterium]|jgi:putative NADPH-quinone reductase